MPKRQKRPAAVPVRETAAVAPLPATRQMTIIAQDPSVKVRGNSKKILMARISIPAKDLIAGPMGYRVQVIDYDSTTSQFNGSHELPISISKEPPAWQNGDARIVNDFRFHAQNAYALVMKTLARFEFALGRRVGWSFGTHQLKVAPHGMLDANAFYSPSEEGLVFGYFEGGSGKNVYTCLSHDIVVHETTHALIDALRERYMDPSSPDQSAFHEGFADVIALLSVFSQRELVHQLLSPSSSPSNGASPTLLHARDLTVEALKTSALFGLADEMGQEVSGIRGEALRHSTTLTPDPKLLETPEFLEPHRRGEIFVAAIMNGFISAWAARISKSGIPGQERYPIGRVAEEGADIAEALATMWIRALDYMPPVHLQFSDALSAALTGDLEVRPDDSRFDLRDHMTKAFRAFGIKPASSAPQGIWKPAPGGVRFDRVRFESMRTDRDEVFRFIWDNRKILGLREGAYSEVLSVRPCVRVGLDGFVLRETVAEYYQVARLTSTELKRRGIKLPADYIAELDRNRRLAGEDGVREDSVSEAMTPLYGGGVLVFDEYGRLKYHVSNDVFGAERQTARLQYLWESGLLEPGRVSARLRSARLSTIHRLRAIDARRFPAEGW